MTETTVVAQVFMQAHWTTFRAMVVSVRMMIVTDRCIIVKINPEDVVSVPLDCECQKLRTTSYEVVKLYEGEMEYNLATDEGLEWEEDYEIYGEADEDWELEDYMDEEESSEVTSPAGLTFQVDTSDLDSFKDRWMNN